MKKHIQITSIVIGSLFVFPLMAATVSLVPSTLTVDEGGQFSVDVMMDAADAPGDHDQLTAFLGNFLVEFDSDVVQYDGFEFQGPAENLLVPATVIPGDPTGVQVGFINALDVGVIGTFNFTVIGTAGDVISISIDHLYSFSTFVNMLPANTGFDPYFNNAEITVVPIPASVWLFASGLGLLGWIRRRGVAVC